MANKKIKIAVVQFRPAFMDVEKNVERAKKFLDKISADIVLFPELFLSGYTLFDKSEVEGVSIDINNSPDLKPFLEISKEKSIAISGGYAERDGKKIYNSSFFIADGKVIANYRKVHLFSHEKNLFSPGDEGFSVFDYRGVKIGMMVCFDWFFPESARTLAIKGAQVILHPANLVLPYCQRAMYARAIENRVFIATANRIGTEKNRGLKNSFTGGSQVVSPTGDYLFKMKRNKEGFRVVEIDPSPALNKDITPQNNIFDDRRKEFYL
jgi:predicted amidohydrolase